MAYLLKLARTMVRHNWRGGHRFTRELGRLGLLKKPARYRIGKAVFTVPVGLLPWDRQDVLEYCPKTIDETARVVKALESPLLIDCGAHIGIFSTLLAAECPNIAEILAIEPNSLWWQWTRLNLVALGIKAQLVKGAVSDFHGKGMLRSPDFDPTPEALYLEPDASGGIEVFRLDDLVPDYAGDVILKLDVEGAELAAMRGAAKLLARARRVVVVIEAHPKIAAASGIDPTEYIRFMRSVRPFDHVVVSDAPDQEVKTGVPFFEQFKPQVYNIVCASL